jgi:hypothetical protein
MLIIFFDIKQIAQKEFALAEQTVLNTSVTFYGDCTKMCEDFISNFGGKGTGCRSTFFRPSPGNFLTKNNMTVIFHPPYSPDFSPATFMFLGLKTKQKGRHFDIAGSDEDAHIT